MIKKAVILAAGRGTRVQRLTYDLPKPVIPLLGSGNRIEPGCTFERPVWIGNGCHIEAGAHIERSVVFDYAHVGANATGREVIVSGSYCVSRDGQADDAPASRWWDDARRHRHSLRGAA